MKKKRRNPPRMNTKTLLFVGAVGVGAYLIYRNFISKSQAGAIMGPGMNVNQPTRLPFGNDVAQPDSFAPGQTPTDGWPSQIYYPDPNGGDGGFVVQTPIESDIGAPGESRAIGISQEEMLEIPGIVTEKAPRWIQMGCNKLKSMRTTYRKLAKKDKDRTTKRKADITARYLDYLIEIHCS